MPEWNVEVTVEGFGPNHALWKRIIQHASAHSTIRLELPLPRDMNGATARIRAHIANDSSIAATRQLMAMIRRAGNVVDRGGLVDWSRMTGKAILCI